MMAMQYSGFVRPDELEPEKVQDSLFTVIKFLEINGRSRDAREYLRALEGLDEQVLKGMFNN